MDKRGMKRGIKITILAAVVLGVFLVLLNLLNSGAPNCVDNDYDRYSTDSPSVCNGYCGEEGFDTCLGYKDCNDFNRDIYPGAPELCDPYDNDCDGEVNEGTVCGFDCSTAEDKCPVANKQIYTDYFQAGESCDSITEQCSASKECQMAEGCVWANGYTGLKCAYDYDIRGWGWIDPAEAFYYCNQPLKTFYYDYDRDGYGNISRTIQARIVPLNYVENSLDCDDNNDAVNPGADEICTSAIDYNCNGLAMCDDSSCVANPACVCLDDDGDGYGREGRLTCTHPNEIDCDDGDDTIYPGAKEICGDEIDQDCSGDDCELAVCEDKDGDGYAVESDTSVCGDLCYGGTGACKGGRDCDDNPTTGAGINPGATEDCVDGIDNDCDGKTDYDFYDGIYGDEDCKVNLAGTPASPDSVTAYSKFPVTCIVNLNPSQDPGRPLDTVFAMVDINPTLCKLYNVWPNFYYNFICDAPGSVGSDHEVECIVATPYSSSDSSYNFKALTVTECTPYACRSGDCEVMDDGCGGTVDCGTCQGANDICDSNNRCQCIATDYTTLCSGVTCAGVDNGCGETVTCDNCPEGETCNPTTSTCESEPPTTCVINGMTWLKSLAYKGEDVSLQVNGTGCNGDVINFDIWLDRSFPASDEHIEDASLGGTDPDSATFVNGVATTTWEAQYFGEPWGSQDFYFKLEEYSVDSRDFSFIPKLTVTDYDCSGVLSCGDYGNNQSACEANPCWDKILASEGSGEGCGSSDDCDSGANEWKSCDCTWNNSQCNFASTEFDCPSPYVPYCGNGILDSENDEKCDGSVPSNINCSSRGATGEVVCDSSCQFDYSGCIGGDPENCGNTVIEVGEDCEGDDLDGAEDCIDLGYDGGDLSCKSNCEYNVSDCYNDDPDPTINPFSWGTCMKNTLGTSSSCTQDPIGFYSYSWDGTWTWSNANSFRTEAACISYATSLGGDASDCDEIDGAWRYDSSTRKTNCEGTQSTTIACPAELELPFFTKIQMLIAVLLIGLVYAVTLRKR